MRVHTDFPRSTTGWIRRSYRSFTAIQKRWRATHDSDQLTAVSCSVAVKRSRRTSTSVAVLFSSFYLCTATHTVIFLLVVCTIDARLSTDETRSFHLRARTRHHTIVGAFVEMLLISIHCYLSAVYVFSYIRVSPLLLRRAVIVYLGTRTFISLYVSVCEQVPRDCIYMNMPRDVVTLVLRDEHTCLSRTHASRVDGISFICILS